MGHHLGSYVIQNQNTRIYSLIYSAFLVLSPLSGCLPLAIPKLQPHSFLEARVGIPVAILFTRFSDFVGLRRLILRHLCLIRQRLTCSTALRNIGTSR